MYLWQANLGRGASPAKFERNLARVLAAGGPRSVFAFQEIDEADTPHEMLILRRLTNHTHQIVGANTAVPILVPRHVTMIDSQQTLACKGLAKYTPNRIVNEALFRLGPNLTVAVLNTHLPLNRPATATRRQEVRQTLRRRARARVEMAGVWVADTNTHRGWPTIVQGEESVIEAGIDKAKAWAPRGRHVMSVTERRNVPLEVDLTIDNHDAHGARIWWERA